jgi:hypothetical protein
MVNGANVGLTIHDSPPLKNLSSPNKANPGKKLPNLYLTESFAYPTSLSNSPAMKKNEKTSRKKKATGGKKPRRLSNQKKPEDLDLRQWQIGLRRQFAEEQAFKLENNGGHPLYSDFTVANPSIGTTYKVAIRSKTPGENYCSCPDFRTSSLGTCKHIEWTLWKLRNTRGMKKYFRQAPPERTYTSVFVDYGEERTVYIRIGTEEEEAFRTLAERFFDESGALLPNAHLEFEHFLAKARDISSDFRCYPDVMELILEKRAREWRGRHFEKLEQNPEKALAGLLKTELFPYQRQGVFFAAKAGRCLIADEMGLGKTIQALAAAELMRRELHITRALIVCPTSLKYQWKSEIEKFTGSTVTVIEGNPSVREKTYKTDENFYQIMTYNVVSRDIKYINEQGADLVILDEAQRIKNWNTKISRAVKQFKTPYCIVLTGTPLENKLEELYSIVQFVDQYRLGPLFLFLHRHQVKNEFGQVIGYQELGRIHERLKDVMIRRRKKEVLKEMPPRLDKVLFVPMTKRQWEHHSEYADSVARIVAKWRRFGFLTEQERQNLLINLNLMRMSCDSTYLIDQQTRHETKIQELMCILEERLADPDEKVVVFSQWERMTRLVSEELEERNIPYAYLHGGVPSQARGELLVRFREDPECLVFLSTDAGGVGLNLQTASMVINLDIPWNPAVLEQRIGRVYRLGQSQPVQVINLVSSATIEQRLLGVLQFKAGLAAGVLDAAEDSIFMSDKKYRKFMESIEEITEGLERGVAVEVSVTDTDMEEIAPTGPAPADEMDEIPEAAAPEPVVPEIEPEPEERPVPKPRPAAKPRELVQMGVSFFSSLSETLSNPEATRELIDSITETDEETGQSYLKIPVESKKMVENALQLFGALMGQGK